MANRNDPFYKRLTSIFSSGPSIARRVKGYDYRNYYDSDLIRGNYGYRGPMPFGRENSPFSVLGAYGILDRNARYAEYAEYESVPEVCAALNVYADETVAGDEKGKAFHLYSKNPEVKRTLEELFYDVLNIDFNLRPWTRNLIKYGDMFLYCEVLPDVGVVNVQPIPVNEIEREEGFDPLDPYAVRFKWLTRGNKYLENWQVLHFRILGQDIFLPYGTSVIEPARRTIRQLILMEDSMLVYRVERSPERRVFYIDIGNIDPNDIPSYMEAAKATLKSRDVVDRTSGRTDQRFNPLNVSEDYFIPVRGGQTGTKIETLAGGQNATATEDVEYLQKKMFAALQVPKAYLNYVENLGAKAALSQLDIRFSRTISVFQRIIISELNKLAMIHLYSKGFDGEDLIDFELRLSNPSTVALQQKLEVLSTKFEIAGKAKETGLVDEEWIRKKILELTQDEIARIEYGLKRDRVRAVELEAVAVQENLPNPNSSVDPFDPSNYTLPGAGVPKNEPLNNGDTTQNTSDLLVKNTDDSVPIIPSSGENRLQNALDMISKQEDLENQIQKIKDIAAAPITATPFLNRARRNEKRRVGQGGINKLNMPDYVSMLSPTNKYTQDTYDKASINMTPPKSLAEAVKFEYDEHEQEFLDEVKQLRTVTVAPSTPNEIKSIFKNLKNTFERLGYKTNEPNLLLNEDDEKKSEFQYSYDNEEPILELELDTESDNVRKILSETKE